MDAQEPRPAEDATAPADKQEESSAETPVKKDGVRTRLLGWMWANIWRKDGRKRDHIPDMPVWIGVIRVLQFVRNCPALQACMSFSWLESNERQALSVATVGLTAYGTAEVQRALGYRRITV